MLTGDGSPLGNVFAAGEVAGFGGGGMATALFAATFPDRLAAGLGEEMAATADALFESMTVVPEAIVARDFGLRDAGVTSMHDATEGGVIGG